MYICELCKKEEKHFETKAGNGFNSHLKKIHNNMTYKDYVVAMEFGGICPTCKTCSKDLLLLKGKVRFPKYCSHHCAAIGENNGMHGKKGDSAPNKGAKRTEEHKEKYRIASQKRYETNQDYLESLRRKTIERVKAGTFSKRKNQISKVFNPNTNQIEVFDSQWEEDFLDFCIKERNIPVTKMHDIEIQYIDSSNTTTKNRIYLPDFIDLENTRIIEVKGKMNQNACDKIEYAQKWANDNKKIYEVWTKRNGKFQELYILGDIWVPVELYGTSSNVHCKEKSLNVNYIKSLSIRERKILAAKLFRFYRKYGFPYKEPNKEEDLVKDFKALKTIESFKEEPQFRLSTAKGKLLIDQFYDKHFHEVANIGRMSMVKAFADDLKLYKVITNRLGISYKEFFNIHGAMIRQGFRSSGQASIVSGYSAEYAKYIYLQQIENLSKKEGINILDFSMGFGQRMLGALSLPHKINYIGIDPWDKQINAAIAMYELVKNHTESTIDLYNCGSEAIINNNNFIEKYGNGKVDIVFTSPPYFDFELYDVDNLSNQSVKSTVNNLISRQKSFESFIGNWLQPTVRMISNVLNKDTGICIINISSKTFKIGKDTISLVDEFIKAFEVHQMAHIKTHVTVNNKVNHFSRASGKDGNNTNEVLLYFKNNKQE